MSDLFDLDICFLAGTLGQGGAERQLFYLLEALNSNGARVSLLSLTRGEFWEEKISDLGVPVTWVGRSSSRAARLLEVVREVRRIRPAIVQSQHSFTNLYAALAARAGGALDIGAIRNDALREIEDLGLLFGPLSRRLPRVMASNSRLGIRNLVAAGVDPSRIRLLPNVVDTDYFAPAPRKNDGTVRIAAIGRLVPQKRFDRFLRVLATAVSRIRTPVKAVIAGTGPLACELENQVAGLGLLDGTVEFAGSVADPREIYGRSDLLVLASDWEGTPNVVLEAMSSALPVLVTSVGDLPEIIRDGETGVLVDPSSEDLLAQRLVELITDVGIRKRLGLEARRFIVEHYSLIRLPSILRQFYDQCTSFNRR